MSEDHSENDDYSQLINADKISDDFSYAEYFRLRSFLIEILEELKIRRSSDFENEARIKQLVQEKYELERKCDMEKQKIQSLFGEHKRQLNEMKRGFEEKIHLVEGENKQLTVYRECGEKEMKSLKDEVRILQLSKYSLEKKLREEERLLQSQKCSAEQQIEELSSLEKKITDIKNNFQNVSQSHERLEKNVTEAAKLNKTLMYVNKHQKCVMEHYKCDKKNLQSQLIEMKVRLEAKPKQFEDIQKYITDNASLSQQIKNLTLQKDDLIEQLDKSNTKYEAALQELQTAHTLVQRHCDFAERFKKEIQIIETDRAMLQEKVKSLEHTVETLQTELSAAHETHALTVADHTKTNTELKDEVEMLKNSVESVNKSKSQLEELNSQWAQKNIEVTTELEEAKAKLNVPKKEEDQQTEISLFSVVFTASQTESSICSRDTQTVVDISNTTTQTERTSSSWEATQTIDAALANTAAQTDQVTLSSKQVQTDKQTSAGSTNNNAMIIDEEDAACVVNNGHEVHDVNIVQDIHSEVNNVQDVYQNVNSVPDIANDPNNVQNVESDVNNDVINVDKQASDGVVDADPASCHLSTPAEKSQTSSSSVKINKIAKEGSIGAIGVVQQEVRDLQMQDQTQSILQVDPRLSDANRISSNTTNVIETASNMTHEQLHMSIPGSDAVEGVSKEISYQATKCSTSKTKSSGSETSTVTPQKQTLFSDKGKRCSTKVPPFREASNSQRDTLHNESCNINPGFNTNTSCGIQRHHTSCSVTTVSSETSARNVVNKKQKTFVDFLKTMTRSKPASCPSTPSTPVSSSVTKSGKLSSSFCSVCPIRSKGSDSKIGIAFPFGRGVKNKRANSTESSERTSTKKMKRESALTSNTSALTGTTKTNTDTSSKQTQKNKPAGSPYPKSILKDSVVGKQIQTKSVSFSTSLTSSKVFSNVGVDAQSHKQQSEEEMLLFSDNEDDEDDVYFTDEYRQVRSILQIDRPKKSKRHTNL